MYIYIYIYIYIYTYIYIYIYICIYIYMSGLNKLRARRRACTQCARKGFTEFIGSTPMLFKKVSYFCV